MDFFTTPKYHNNMCQ